MPTTSSPNLRYKRCVAAWGAHTFDARTVIAARAALAYPLRGCTNDNRNVVDIRLVRRIIKAKPVGTGAHGRDRVHDPEEMVPRGCRRPAAASLRTGVGQTAPPRTQEREACTPPCYRRRWSPFLGAWLATACQDPSRRQRTLPKTNGRRFRNSGNGSGVFMTWKCR